MYLESQARRLRSSLRTASILLAGLKHNNTGNRINSLSRQLQCYAVIISRKLKLTLRAYQQIRFLNYWSPRWNPKFAILRPVEHVHVNAPWFAGRAPKGELTRKRAGGCAVDSRPICFHPSAHLAQAFDARLRY